MTLKWPQYQPNALGGEVETAFTYYFLNAPVQTPPIINSWLAQEYRMCFVVFFFVALFFVF